MEMGRSSKKGHGSNIEQGNESNWRDKDSSGKEDPPEEGGSSSEKKISTGSVEMDLPGEEGYKEKEMYWVHNLLGARITKSSSRGEVYVGNGRERGGITSCAGSLPADPGEIS